MDKDDIIAAALVSLIAVSLSAYLFRMPNLIDFNSYKNAVLVKDAAAGSLSAGKPLYYYSVSFLYSMVSQASGKSGFDGGLMVTTIKLFQLLCSALVAASLYSLLRNFFTRTASLVGCVLALTSPAILTIAVAPVASPEFFGITLFTIGVALFFHSRKISFYPYALIGSILMGLSLFTWEGAVVAFAAFLLSVLLQVAYNYRSGKNDGFLMHCLIMLIAIGIISYFLTGYGLTSASPAVNALLYGYTLLVPLLALFVVFLIAGFTGLRFYEMEPEQLVLCFSALSIALSFFEPLALMPGLALASALSLEGMRKAAEDLRAVAAMIFVFAFLFSLALVASFMSVEQAVVAALLIAVSATALAVMYQNMLPGKLVVAFILAAILFSSLSYAFLNVSSMKSEINGELISALNWVRDNTDKNAVVAGIGERDMIEFVADRQSPDIDPQLTSFLLTNSSVGALKSYNVTHVILYADLFDEVDYLSNLSNVSGVAMGSFAPLYETSDQSGNPYLILSSQSGVIASAQLDPRTNAFLDANVVLSYSDQTAYVPFRKFVIIKNANNTLYRLVYPQLDSYNTNLFKAFFSKVDGLERAYPDSGGIVVVYKVV